ncbi:MAG: permease-like cell division protein FtsX, partial [Oleiphilaceae bacterium]|nr:permease-like cell division protein FtsX [Oleiphilaceae bacterium]
MVKGASSNRPPQRRQNAPSRPGKTDRSEAPKRKRRGADQARSPWREQLDSYLQHHRSSAADSGLRLWHSPLSSMMTGMVIAIALALPVILLLVLASVQQLSGDWRDSARIAVYMSQDAEESQARSLQQQWQESGAFSQVRFIHRDEALESFRAEAGLEEALDYLDHNPLPHTLIFTPVPEHRDEATLRQVMDELEALPEVDRVQLDMAWLQRLNAMAELMRQAVWVLGLLLGV